MQVSFPLLASSRDTPVCTAKPCHFCLLFFRPSFFRPVGIQSVTSLDENLTEKGRKKAEKRGWRVKLVYTQDVDTGSNRFHLGGTRPAGGGVGGSSHSVVLKTQDVVFRFKAEKDMQAWIQRLTLLSSKWR